MPDIRATTWTVLPSEARANIGAGGAGGAIYFWAGPSDATIETAPAAPPIPSRIAELDHSDLILELQAAVDALPPGPARNAAAERLQGLSAPSDEHTLALRTWLAQIARYRGCRGCRGL